MGVNAYKQIKQYFTKQFWAVFFMRKLTKAQQEQIVFEWCRDEVVNSVLAEKLISEIVKDQHNKVISFVIKD